MKILVIDHDEVSARLLKSRLEPLGHDVTWLSDKTEGSLEASKADFEVVFIDPSPQTNPKPMVVNIRRHIRYYPYMILLSEKVDQEQALGFGFNDCIAKPLDPEELDRKIEGAQNFLNIVRHLRNGNEDFPSSGGIIAKSAINQLFLSCIDRADRYGERTYALFINLRNFKQIAVQTGPYEAEVAAAKLAQHIVRLRRASDIIGQIGRDEFAILLLRPVDEKEPLEAAGRFADSLASCSDIMSKSNMQVDLSVNLVEIPSGQKLAEHTVTLKN